FLCRANRQRRPNGEYKRKRRSCFVNYAKIFGSVSSSAAAPKAFGVAEIMRRAQSAATISELSRAAGLFPRSEASIVDLVTKPERGKILPAQDQYRRIRASRSDRRQWRTRRMERVRVAY